MFQLTQGIGAESISKRILLLPGKRILLDSALAELYGVTTRRLNEQVRRNRARFPEDFLLELSREEVGGRAKFAISPGMRKLLAAGVRSRFSSWA